MKDIKCLIESMYMEIDAAECYYHKAVKFKEDHPKISQTYIDVAKQELEHCDRFHTEAVNLISKYKSEHAEDVSPYMQEVWDFEHTRLMDVYDKVKYKISKF